MILNICSALRNHMLYSKCLRKTICWNKVLNKSIHASSKHENCATITNEKWRPVYQFRLIRFAASLNRLKIYQAGLTIIGIPLLYTLQNFAYIPDDVPDIFTAIGKV